MQATESEAIDIPTSVIDPDTLRKYDEPTATTTATPYCAGCCPPPRQSGRRRPHQNAWDLNQSQWNALCKEHGIDFPVNQTTIMSQEVQVCMYVHVCVRKIHV